MSSTLFLFQSAFLLFDCSEFPVFLIVLSLIAIIVFSTLAQFVLTYSGVLYPYRICTNCASHWYLCWKILSLIMISSRKIGWSCQSHVFLWFSFSPVILNTQRKHMTIHLLIVFFFFCSHNINIWTRKGSFLLLIHVKNHDWHI